MLTLVALGLAVAAAGLWLLPRHYEAREQLAGVVVFWHDDEAFVFVDRYEVARGVHVLAERLPRSGDWAVLAALLSDWRGLGSLSTAYRVNGGTLERHALANAVTQPAWDLENGTLVARSGLGVAGGRGFRWTGAGFERLPLAEDAPGPRPGPRTLESDDVEHLADAAEAPALVAGEARARFLAAGWHWKRLNGYEGIHAPTALPVALASGRCTLTLRSERRDDPLLPIATRLELTGERLAPGAHVLFADAGWRGITRAELEAKDPGRGRGSWLSGAWLVVLVLASILAVLLKAGGLLGALFPFLGLRKRLVGGVGTTMSFPPALPEQFPKLDRARLDAWSAELERLGFERLLDTSPVADTPRQAPSFCRIYAHRRHGSFGLLMQSFPALGERVDLRCMLNGYLDDGWSVGASNGRPLAASHLVRRPRAIGFSRPGEPVEALFARFLRFREQVCRDLGVGRQADTSLEAYVRRTLESLAEIRAALAQRSLALGVGRYWARRLGARGASDLVWLGDYPNLAEEKRAAGLGPGFSGTAVLD